MSEQKLQEQQTVGNDQKTARSARSWFIPFRLGTVFWALIFGAVLYMQWPMLKGMYYRVSDAEAPMSAVEWRSGFDAALAEAEQVGKPVLVDFTASWCPPCKVMKHEVWPDDDVAAAVNENYVPLLVDVDDPNGAEVARRYGVYGIPTIMVLDASGQVLRVGSFMSAAEMLEFLDSA